MVEKQFEIKPDFVASITPYYLRWGFRFTLVAIFVYGLIQLLEEMGLLAIAETPLRISLLLIVLLGSFISSKHKMIKLHQTKYIFYDTHIVLQTKMLRIQKQSMPYFQISKVTNNSNILQRVTNVSDIILHRVSGEDFVLKSVRDPDEIEHKIYLNIKRAKGSNSDAGKTSAEQQAQNVESDVLQDA